MCLPLLLLPGWGCGENSASVDETRTMSTDMMALKRLIHLPRAAKQGEWQTGKFAPHGGDWWVAAVLSVDADQMGSLLQGPAKREIFETPPGLALVSAFAALRTLPEAQQFEPGRIRLVTDTHAVEPYAKSPLRNGQAIRLSASTVLVLLWTN